MSNHKLMDKYNPKEFEENLYNEWEKKGYFKPSMDKRKLLYSNATTKCNRKITYGTCIRWNNARYVNKI